MSSVVNQEQNCLRSDLGEEQQHFIEHLQTVVAIIVKSFDLWSRKYENGVGKNSAHFVVADIVIVSEAESLVA